MAGDERPHHEPLHDVATDRQVGAAVDPAVGARRARRQSATVSALDRSSPISHPVAPGADSPVPILFRLIRISVRMSAF